MTSKIKHMTIRTRDALWRRLNKLTQIELFAAGLAGAQVLECLEKTDKEYLEWFRFVHVVNGECGNRHINLLPSKRFGS